MNYKPLDIIKTHTGEMGMITAVKLNQGYHEYAITFFDENENIELKNTWWEPEAFIVISNITSILFGESKMIEQLIQTRVAYVSDRPYDNFTYYTSSINTLEIVSKINEIIDVLNNLLGSGQEMFEPVILGSTPDAPINNKLGCGPEVKTPGFEPDNLGSTPSVPANEGIND